MKTLRNTQVSGKQEKLCYDTAMFNKLERMNQMTPKQLAAIQQALNTLNQLGNAPDDEVTSKVWWWAGGWEAIEALEEAIAEQQAAEPGALGPLARRRVFDYIRGAYDLGYSDARNAKAVKGDGAPGYKGRDVEADHGGALLNALNAQVTQQAADHVLVPLNVLEAAESSLATFIGDQGWGDEDMQNMDNLSAYIAQHKAATIPAPQPTQQPLTDEQITAVAWGIHNCAQGTAGSKAWV